MLALELSTSTYLPQSINFAWVKLAFELLKAATVGHGQKIEQVGSSTNEEYYSDKSRLLVTVWADFPGTAITPPHAAAKMDCCPCSEATIPAKIEITRNTIVMMKVKSPYGIAKHGFFHFPVQHPRHPISKPIAPMKILR